MSSSDRVQAEVDRLAATLGLAVLVEDARFQPLWWSAQGEADGTRVRSILQRAVDPAAAALVLRWGLPTAEEPVRTPAVPELDMVARWCVPLRSRGTLYGYLWVLDPVARVTEGLLPQLVACSAHATECLVRQRRGEDERRNHRTRLLERLRRHRDVAAAEELMVVEDLPVGVDVVVCFPARPGGWELRGSMSAHTGPAPDGPATSGPPVALVDLRVAVRRARLVDQVLRAGAVLPEPTWSALGSWHLIAAAPDGLAVSDIHPAAELLLGLPRPELAETTRMVLDLGGDIARAAAALHIHRTTLYYRLDRIQALTGVSLKDGTARDDLHSALRLAAFRGAAATS